MWALLGIGAIIFAVLGLIWAIQNKNAKWFSFLSLSLTALTLCAFYSDAANRVVSEDWGGLMDIMPTMNRVLWICTVVSILINAFSISKEKSKNN